MSLTQQQTVGCAAATVGLPRDVLFIALLCFSSPPAWSLHCQTERQALGRTYAYACIRPLLRLPSLLFGSTNLFDLL